MYSLIVYCDSYSRISGSLWQHRRDEISFTNNVSVPPRTANLESFKFKSKFTESIASGKTKVVAIAVSLKCFSSFWRTLEFLLTNGEVSIKAT